MSSARQLIIGAQYQDTSFISDTKDMTKSLQEMHGVSARVAGQVAKLDVAIHKQIATFGMSTNEIKLWELAQKGVPPVVLKSVAALQDQLDALQKAKKAQDDFVETGGRYGQVTRGLSTVSGAAAKIGETFAKIAAVGTAAAIGFGAFIRSQLQSVDDMGDAAQRIGLSVEAYQKLRLGLQYTGSSAEDLDGIFVKLNNNLQDATKGTGPAADAFKKIGLDPKKLIGDADAFYKIADGIAAIPTQAGRTAASLDILGKSGANIANSISAGSAALKAIGAQGLATGMILSQSEADWAGKANDSIDKVAGLFSALGKKIAVGFAPVIVALGDTMMEWAAQSLNATSVVNQTLTTTSDGIKTVIDGVNVLRSFWTGTQSAISKGIQTWIGLLSNFTGVLDSAIGLVTGTAGTTSNILTSATDEFGNLADKQWKTAAAAYESTFGDKVKGSFDAITAKAKAAGAAIDGTGGKIDSTMATLSGQIDDLKDDLQKKIETHGLNEFESKLLDIRKAGLPITKEIQDLADKYKSIGLNESPLTKFKKDSAELSRLYKGGFLSNAAFESQMGKAKIDAGGTETALQKWIRDFKQIDELQKAKLISPEQGSEAKKAAHQTAMGGTTDLLKTPMSQLKTDTDLLNKQLSQGIINQQMYNTAIDKVRKTSLGWISEAIQGPSLAIGEKLKELKDALKNGIISKQDAKKAGKKLSEEAFPGLDALKTDSTKLSEYAEQLNQGISMGLLNKNQASQLFGQKVNEVAPGQETHASGVLEAGSADARSAILAYNSGGNKNKGLDAVAKNTAQQVVQLNRLNQNFGNMFNKAKAPQEKF